MTAKDKAIELVDRLKGVTRPFSKSRTLKVDIHPEHAKQCALICVDEILDAVTTIADKRFDFYTEVKKEIENI